MDKTSKQDIENVSCPFCGAKIKGEIPKGLKLKEILEFIKKALKKMEEK